MRSIGRKLNGILVTVNLLLEDVRRHFSLAKKALGDAAADIDDARDPGANRDLGHVQNVLLDVELIFLFPWGLVFDQVGWAGYGKGLLFIGTFVIGGVYAWRKRALEWNL